MRKKGAALPKNWAPSKDDVIYGINLGFTESQVAGMAEDMRLWAEANANRPITKKARWGAAFKGWMRRETAKRGMNGHATETSRMSYMDIAQGLRDSNDQRDSAPDFFADTEPQYRGARHH